MYIPCPLGSASVGREQHAEPTGTLWEQKRSCAHHSQSNTLLGFIQGAELVAPSGLGANVDTVITSKLQMCGYISYYISFSMLSIYLFCCVTHVFSHFLFSLVQYHPLSPLVDESRHVVVSFLGHTKSCLIMSIGL